MECRKRFINIIIVGKIINKRGINYYFTARINKKRLNNHLIKFIK